MNKNGVIIPGVKERTACLVRTISSPKSMRRSIRTGHSLTFNLKMNFKTKNYIDVHPMVKNGNNTLLPLSMIAQ